MTTPDPQNVFSEVSRQPRHGTQFRDDESIPNYSLPTPPSLHNLVFSKTCTHQEQQILLHVSSIFTRQLLSQLPELPAMESRHAHRKATKPIDDDYDDEEASDHDEEDEDEDDEALENVDLLALKLLELLRSELRRIEMMQNKQHRAIEEGLTT